MEFLEGIDATGLDLAGYYGHWVKTSGVHAASAVAQEFKNHVEVLRHMLLFDQIDVSNLASAEYVCRRCLQIQRAVRRSPRHPTFDGLEAMLSTALDESGGVVTTRFDEFVAAEQKVAATIQKSQRLAQEEAEADRKRHAKSGADDGAAAPKGGGRGKS